MSTLYESEDQEYQKFITQESYEKYKNKKVEKYIIREYQKFITQELYETNLNNYFYYFFTSKIRKIAREPGFVIDNNEFTINNDEKFCIFSDYKIKGSSEIVYKGDHKIILKPKPKSKKFARSFNIFIFNH